MCWAKQTISPCIGFSLAVSGAVMVFRLQGTMRSCQQQLPCLSSRRGLRVEAAFPFRKSLRIPSSCARGPI